MPTPSVILDRKLRFAVVGCGRIVQSHFKALQQHASRAELVALCDNQPDAPAAAVPSPLGYLKALQHQAAYAHHCRPDCCPVSVAVSETVLSLPMSADLRAEQQDRVAAALHLALAQAGAQARPG